MSKRLIVFVVMLALVMGALGTSAYFMPRQDPQLVKKLERALDITNKDNNFTSRKDENYGAGVRSIEFVKTIPNNGVIGDVTVRYHFFLKENQITDLSITIQYVRTGVQNSETTTYYFDDADLDGKADFGCSIGPYWQPGYPGSAMIGTLGTIVPRGESCPYQNQYNWAIRILQPCDPSNRLDKGCG